MTFVLISALLNYFIARDLFVVLQLGKSDCKGLSLDVHTICSPSGVYYLALSLFPKKKKKIRICCIT